MTARDRASSPSCRCHPEERVPAHGSTSGSTGPSQTHAVCVLDDAGTGHAEFTGRPHRRWFDQLFAGLAGSGDPATLPVAIERPDGRLVDALLEAGHPVVAVQPNAIKAWRDAEVCPAPSPTRRRAADRRVPAAAPSPAARAAPFSAETRALRAVVRTRGDLVDQRVATANQLGACLDAFWPGAKGIFADVATPIALDFLARYPTPESAANLGERRMAAFLIKHGYCGRRPAGQLLARLRAAPAGHVRHRHRGRRDAVLALVGVLRALPADQGSRPVGGRPPR